jgi:hypothetical protein
LKLQIALLPKTEVREEGQAEMDEDDWQPLINLFLKKKIVMPKLIWSYNAICNGSKA